MPDPDASEPFDPTDANGASYGQAGGNLEVDLPSGGKLHLQTVAEVEMWETSSERYQDDYSLIKHNDLVLLSALLSQQLALYRAQQRLNGMEPQFTAGGVPTGTYAAAGTLKPSEQAASRHTIEKAAKEIRELESALGIDKKSREAGGTHTVANYVETLKRSAHSMGVHIATRTKAYEQFVMELRWKLRLLDNGDAEDLQYHNLSPESLLKWVREEVATLEQVDQDYAHERGKLFLGQA